MPPAEQITVGKVRNVSFMVTNVGQMSEDCRLGLLNLLRSVNVSD